MRGQFENEPVLSKASDQVLLFISSYRCGTIHLKAGRKTPHLQQIRYPYANAQTSNFVHFAVRINRFRARSLEIGQDFS
jgi:hypothetical protein